MELLMVREGLHRWMVENKQQLIMESEMGKSQAILAAKDMVDMYSRHARRSKQNAKRTNACTTRYDP